MYATIRDQLAQTLAEIDAAGLYKHERQLTGPQDAHIGVATPGERWGGRSTRANNYLGLVDHPDVLAAARCLLGFRFGAPSVRFICGTQTQHKQLERALRC